MTKNKWNLLILSLAFISLNVYLFASAPAPLPDKTASTGHKMVAIQDAFALLARENDETRAIYTSLIVGNGQKVNLQFREDWKDPAVEAGPLPALFLRGTATYLEKNPLPLSLFLGSDYPISAANKFSGIQEKYFNEMKKDRQPRYFFDENSKMHTAMFPDVASVASCVSCHNEHIDSPKKDWKLGDIMGATTWTFPEDSVSVEKITGMIAVYREAVQHTYNTYLEEVNQFSSQPKPYIGEKWPSEGYFLPSTQVLLDSVNAIASPLTLHQLLILRNDKIR